MTYLLAGALIGFLAAVAILLVPRLLRRGRNRLQKPTIDTIIEHVKAVGELTVLRVVTKEIVTAKDHWAGEWGKRYLEWFWGSTKMALILEFEIDYRFNLRDPAFTIEEEGLGVFRMMMPRCRYGTRITKVSFYDEKVGKLLDWLLPSFINPFGGSSEENKNRLIVEAIQQAESLAGKMEERLRPEVQASARQVLNAIARGFGVSEVIINFGDSQAEGMEVRYAASGVAASA